MFLIFIILLYFVVSHSFQFKNLLWQSKFKRHSYTIETNQLGENLPQEFSELQTTEYTILIERLNRPKINSFGLLLPTSETEDKRHFARILKLPNTEIVTAKSARTVPNKEYIQCQVGDYVYVEDAWGIGPKDLSEGERCFSFIKPEKILAVVRGEQDDISRVQQ